MSFFHKNVLQQGVISTPSHLNYRPVFNEIFTHFIVSSCWGSGNDWRYRLANVLCSHLFQHCPLDGKTIHLFHVPSDATRSSYVSCLVYRKWDLSQLTWVRFIRNYDITGNIMPIDCKCVVSEYIRLEWNYLLRSICSTDFKLTTTHYKDYNITPFWSLFF